MNFLQYLAPNSIPNKRQQVPILNGMTKSLMEYGWIDGKKPSNDSQDWIWTDGTNMCQLKNVVDEIDEAGMGGGDCLELGLFKLSDNAEPNSRIKKSNCTKKQSYLCKKELKPCVPNPGLPCNIPGFQEDGETGEGSGGNIVLSISRIGCSRTRHIVLSLNRIHIYIFQMSSYFDYQSSQPRRIYV